MTRAVFIPILLAALAGKLCADEALQRQTWQIPSATEVRSRIQAWLAESEVTSEQRAQVASLWQDDVPTDMRLDRLVETLAIVSPAADELRLFCLGEARAENIRPFSALGDEDASLFVRGHLQLFFARWLAHRQLYNEVLEITADLEVTDVVDPATLLFYRAIAQHRLLQKSACLPTVRRLLEREEEIPRRYARLAELMRADIEPLKPDSLDEISRLMDSVRVRLGHGRAGTRVRQEEQDVIDKLDKMIKQLEEQAQQAAAAAQAGGTPGENLQPATPMQDSVPGGGTGPGNVDPRSLGDKSGWGDLPPKQRQAALQDLGKEFPSHYRDVIEEFFRKLAKDGADQ